MPANVKRQAIRYDMPVRVSVPASVAYDLNAFQKSIANLVERLGCPTCFSGADCRFQLERDFAINEKLEVAPATRLSEPVPSPWSQERVARVTLSSKVGYDLKQVQATVATIAGKLGCAGCCSGFDIIWQRELEFIVDESANVRAV